MAQKIEVSLVDDLDGGTADSTVQFSVNGVDYEMDLAEPNVDAFMGAIAPFLDCARRLRGGKVAARSGGAAVRQRIGASAGTIRAWAQAQPDIELKPRGRIPQNVKDRFEAAHSG